MTNPRIDLHVPVFGQRDAECGNTSLKSVLRFFGKRVSAKHLATLAGATDEGIDHAGLVEAARRTGAAVFERAHGSVHELRWFLGQKLPIIVGWWSRAEGDVDFDERWSLAERRDRDCGHFSVVSGIDHDRILFMDPQWKIRRGRPRIVGRQWMPIREFRKVWYDTDTTRYLRVDRWYMVAHPGSAPFGPLLHGGVDHAPLVAVRHAHDRTAR
jgi:ABC-type bacteriocin/lantibiotic exporter with double-glycine peptidase domain